MQQYTRTPLSIMVKCRFYLSLFLTQDFLLTTLNILLLTVNCHLLWWKAVEKICQEKVGCHALGHESGKPVTPIIFPPLIPMATLL